MSVQLQLGGAQTKLEGPQARVYAGRDASSCQLAHLDATLSRRHAEIFTENGQTFIRDLGSANGTWVDGQAVGHNTVPINPGAQVWLGHVQLMVTWHQDGQQMGATAFVGGGVPEQLKQMIAQRQQQMQAAPLAATPVTSTPTPAEMSYRKQGANSNGTLLIALKQDTFFNGGTVDGFIEFTSTDRQTVASITINLIEHYKGGPYNGHVWDHMVVRQGPWRAENGDVLPLPFHLRIPPGTSMSSRTCNWDLRADVDINWGSDIDCTMPITMRNQDIERLRDALGAMDYRVDDIEAIALGQTYKGEFHPPGHLAKDWGVNKVELTVDYLGTNLKVRLRLDRKGLHHDPAVDQIFDLARFRAGSQQDVNSTVKQMLDGIMPKK